MPIIFLHNAKCSKSREALKMFSETKRGFTLREYLKNPLDYNELLDLKDKLGLNAIEFTRVNEAEFKDYNLTKESSDEEILKAMSRSPRIMQRPIIFDDNKAFIGRPTEDILKIIN